LTHTREAERWLSTAALAQTGYGQGRRRRARISRRGEHRRSYAEEARALMRERLLDAVGALLADRDRASVTMADIARGAGVSRQTLYNEFGSRQEFAQAYVLREADRFLSAAEDAIAEHADDPEAALTAAFSGFLAAAAENPLVRAIVSGDPGSGLLALVTTRGALVVGAATVRLAVCFVATWPQLPDRDAHTSPNAPSAWRSATRCCRPAPPTAPAHRSRRCLGPTSRGSSPTARAPAARSRPARAREREAVTALVSVRGAARHRRSARRIELAAPVPFAWCDGKLRLAARPCAGESVVDFDSSASSIGWSARFRPRRASSASSAARAPPFGTRAPWMRQPNRSERGGRGPRLPARRRRAVLLRCGHRCAQRCAAAPAHTSHRATRRRARATAPTAAR
jgi:AcrR family transcriptional regulator